MDILRDNERLDDLQIKGYQIIQDPKRFCFGMDAVLLSDFVCAKWNYKNEQVQGTPEEERDPGNLQKVQRILDLGTGTGIIPILLAAKTSVPEIRGLEIQEASVDMAVRSVQYNHLEDRIQIIQGDIKEAAEIYSAASFDVITSNPPYMIDSHGLKNPYEPKNIARHEILCTLEDVVKAAAYLVRPGGSFCLIHKPFRLVEIMQVLTAYKLEPKRMRLVHPYVDKEPNMVMIEAVRGGRPRITVERPLIIYREQGVYTEDVRRIYE